jgi:hypothetical protein
MTEHANNYDEVKDRQARLLKKDDEVKEKGKV